MTFGFIIVTEDGGQEHFTVEAANIAQATQKIGRAWANCIAIWETDADVDTALIAYGGV